MAGLGRRARSIDEFRINIAAAMAFPTERYRLYEPREGDVFLTSWAKSGTTMMQQMFHQLRMAAATGAPDMDFDDISAMVPWEDTARLVDFDMNVEQRAAPRGFKSHREYERLPPGMRYVVTLRDPRQTFVSYHRFFDGWHFERGAVPMEDFFPVWIGGGPGGCDYATHLLSWYARREEPDTLLATYGWAAANRAAMIRRLARFLGLELTPQVAAIVEEHTSRAFMRAHRDRFDDRMICAALEAKVGVPAASDSAKVQATGSDASILPPSIAERIDALWAERIAPATGHADFASLAAEIDARNPELA